MSDIPFQTIDWTTVEKVEYKGETGTAFWQTLLFFGFLRQKVALLDNFDYLCIV